MQLMLDGETLTIDTQQELRDHLAQARESQFTEVFLSQAEVLEDDTLCALVNGDRGWLMHLPADNEVGFSSRDPNYAGPKEALLEFRLSNGQVDEYPVRWTLPTETVVRALEYYFKYGERPP